MKFIECYNPLICCLSNSVDVHARDRAVHDLLCYDAAGGAGGDREVHVRFDPHPGELTLEAIKQFYIAIDREEWKFEVLCDLYSTLTITLAIIYCNIRRS